MKFWLPFSSTSEVVQAFDLRFKSASLPASVSILLGPGPDSFGVQIRKGRTSVLTFLCNPSEAKTTVELIDQSVSVFHKPFMGDVRDWIDDHVKSMGGDIL